MTLTKRQKEVLDFLVGFSNKHGYSPSFEEIARALRLTSLATKEGVSQPSMTQLIQRLERQGLVTRLADPGDGRVALVAITQAGQNLLDARTRRRRDRLSALLTTLTAEERSALWLSAQVALPILHRLIDTAQSLDSRCGSEIGSQPTTESRMLLHRT